MVVTLSTQASLRTAARRDTRMQVRVTLPPVGGTLATPVDPQVARQSTGRTLSRGGERSIELVRGQDVAGEARISFTRAPDFGLLQVAAFGVPAELGEELRRAAAGEQHRRRRVVLASARRVREHGRRRCHVQRIARRRRLRRLEEVQSVGLGGDLEMGHASGDATGAWGP